jgi:hypothetical protein
MRPELYRADSVLEVSAPVPVRTLDLLDPYVVLLVVRVIPSSPDRPVGNLWRGDVRRGGVPESHVSNLVTDEDLRTGEGWSATAVGGACE